MDVQVVSRNIEMEQDKLETIRERCQRLCGRFIDRINSVSMRLDDINGPKGGVDKECLLRIHLQNGGVITAVKRHQHVDNAITKTLDTARALMRRRLGERKRR